MSLHATVHLIDKTARGDAYGFLNAIVDLRAHDAVSDAVFGDVEPDIEGVVLIACSTIAREGAEAT